MGSLANRIKGQRLSLKLSLVGLLIMILGGIIGTVTFIYYQYSNTQDTLQEKINTIISSTEEPLVAALFNFDQVTVQKITQGLASYPEIAKAEVYESSGQFSTAYNTRQNINGIWLKLVHTISNKQLIFEKHIFDPMDEKIPIGKLILTIDPALVLIPALKHGLNFIAIFMIINIFLLLTLGYMLHRLATQPLSDISKMISDLDPKSITTANQVPANKFSTKEFRMLANATNKFLSALNQHLEEKSLYENKIINAEQSAQNSRLQLIDAIESINDGFILRDKDQKIVLCNSRFLSLYPSAASFIEEGSDYLTLLRKAAETEVILHEPAENWIATRSFIHLDKPIIFEDTLKNNRKIRVTEINTSTGGVVSIHSDITELKIAEDELRYRADYDLLTGMLNRDRLIQHLQEMIVHSKRNHSKIAVLFLDLDRFKNINDTLGHSFGDELLKQVGTRIQNVIRETDFCARMGGDEFAIILTEISSERACAVVSQKIITALSHTFKIQSNEILVSSSIGISMFPEDGHDVNTLLQYADMAMYQAKHENRGMFKFFSKEMSQHAEMFIKIEHELTQALKNNEFYLNYQPIVCLANNSKSPPQIHGVEVLIRWNHPERGLIPPDQFISIAEETGQIKAIGEWVLLTACQQAMEWINVVPCYLGINVSYRQFKKGFNSQTVKEILDITNFPAHCLRLEITESLLINDDKQMLNTLNELREMGIYIVIDDFGTGYSSLSYLRKYPVNVLKIDKSFIQGMESNISNKQIVETIIAMARGLDLTVVAEGVETRQQVEILQQLTCQYAQGFYFSKPLSLEDFLLYLSDIKS